jgi:hypothetical protein
MPESHVQQTAPATGPLKSRDAVDSPAQHSDDGEMPVLDLQQAQQGQAAEQTRPLRPSSIMRLQRGAGNQAVLRFLSRSSAAAQRPIERQAETPHQGLISRGNGKGGAGAPAVFDPQISTPAAMTFMIVGSETSWKVKVSNAKRADKGTKFQWRWAENPKDIDAGPNPPEGSDATLKSTPKQYFKDGFAKPELQVTLPDGTIVTKPGTPISVGCLQPSVSWSRSDGTSSAAPLKLKVGESATIKAAFDSLDKPQGHGVKLLSMTTAVPPGMADFQVGAVAWPASQTASVELTAKGAGRASYMLSASIPGIDEGPNVSFDVLVVSDLRRFKDRCSTAQTTLDAAYAAGDEFFGTCSTNYKLGYDAHKAALDAQAGADKLAAELILGVLFAAVGGAAGGAVGALMGTAAKNIEIAVSKAAAGAVTDAAKDTAKFLARLPAKAGPSAGPPVPATTATTTAPTGVSGGGSGAAAATDPFGWYLQVQTAMAGEKRQSLANLKKMQDWVDDAMLNDVTQEVDWDPVEVVTSSATVAGSPLGQLGTPPSADAYEKAFWVTWISQFAYKLVYYPGDVPFGSGYGVEGGIGRKVKKEIDRIANKFGETGDVWIREYASDLHDRLEKEKDKKNDE